MHIWSNDAHEKKAQNMNKKLINKFMNENKICAIPTNERRKKKKYVCLCVWNALSGKEKRHQINEWTNEKERVSDIHTWIEWRNRRSNMKLAQEEK